MIEIRFSRAILAAARWAGDSSIGRGSLEAGKSVDTLGDAPRGGFLLASRQTGADARHN